MLAASQLCGGGAVSAAPAASNVCGQKPDALGVSRTIQIDASTGALFGSVTKQPREASFLKRKEVVLTFDDGPMPWVTKSILDTLDAYCTKATFFAVGRMALAYPATVRDIVVRGHTLGSHTFSHPLNLPRLKGEAARAEIERGFAAVATAAGTPIAPFFRFPGLSDSVGLLNYLQSRNIASFTVDAVSNDSFIPEPDRIAERTLAEVEANKGGIILFHDIKTATAKALPKILTALRERGYTVAHMTAAAPVEPLPELMSEYAPRVAKAIQLQGDKKVLLPFYGAIGPEKENTLVGLAVTPVKPAARDWLAATGTAKPRSKYSDWTPVVYARQPRAAGPTKAAQAPRPPAQTLGWIEEPNTAFTSPPVLQHGAAAATSKNGWTAQVKPDSKPDVKSDVKQERPKKP